MEGRERTSQAERRVMEGWGGRRSCGDSAMDVSEKSAARGAGLTHRRTSARFFF